MANTDARVLRLRAVLQAPCAELPAGGSITIAYSNMQWAHSVATYSCASADHVLTGGDATRTCLVDGSWDGNTPTCTVRLQSLKLHALYPGRSGASVLRSVNDHLVLVVHIAASSWKYGDRLQRRPERWERCDIFLHRTGLRSE